MIFSEKSSPAREDESPSKFAWRVLSAGVRHAFRACSGSDCRVTL